MECSRRIFLQVAAAAGATAAVNPALAFAQADGRSELERQMRPPRDQEELEFFLAPDIARFGEDIINVPFLVNNVLFAEDVKGIRTILRPRYVDVSIEGEAIDRSNIALTRIETDRGIAIELEIADPSFLVGEDFSSLHFSCLTIDENRHWHYDNPSGEFSPNSVASLLRHSEFRKRRIAGNLSTQAGNMENLPPITFYFHDGCLDDYYMPFNGVRIEELADFPEAVFGIHLYDHRRGRITTADDYVFNAEYGDADSVLYSTLMTAELNPQIEPANYPGR